MRPNSRHDAAGASRLKALYDSVPHGQWVPLDMDIAGIWKYWGHDSPRALKSFGHRPVHLIRDSPYTIYRAAPE
jgi:hypothetical protein